MKWNNPGNELKTKYLKISDKYVNKKIYIYGAGIVGGRVYESVASLTKWEIVGFFDIDETKKKYKGLPVYHRSEMNEILQRNPNSIIVVGLLDSLGKKTKNEIIKECEISLQSCVLYEEFIRHDFPIIMLHKYKKVFMDTITMIVSERCTLRCKKCSIMLPYFKNIKEFPFIKLKSEADAFFRMVDFVGNYTLTGGEPLLNAELPQIVEYIGQNYRSKIGSFQIITNGMISLSEELILLAKKYDIIMQVSDYTKAVPNIKEQVLENLQKYKNNGIRVDFLKDVQWVDFGFETVQHNMSEEQLMAFFDYCRTRCRGYVDGKIRYCINGYFAAKALGKEEDSNNFLDIANLKHSMEEKGILVEFDLGYNKDGYLHMCRQCNGTCEINKNFIEVGEQWGKF
ncbi:MAG: hypothetical protein IJA36_11820 [Lachnospiraceae bacterium]|nr:hypothetical protein [Lachnospiraceae bacterium]